MTDRDRISGNENEIAELRVQVATLITKQDELVKKVDKFSSGINRALWLIGGGFISYVVWFFTTGSQ